jgi:putative Holliday junction resolvase
MMAVLGLDFGRKRIGVAICDDREANVLPLGTVQRRGGAKGDIEQISTLLAGRQVTRVVVGLPLNMDGSEGAAARQAHAFAARLRASLGLPVELFDERLTSVEARERIARSEVSGRRRKQAVDAVAAMVILEGWLEARRVGR